MPEKVLRKYGEQAVIDFTLFEIDGVNFKTDASAAVGDIKIGMDEGPEVDTTNTFVDRGTGYSFQLEATETAAKRIFIPIVDQDATKTWLDDYIMVETYGHTNAMHSFNLDADLSTNTEEWKFKSLDLHNTDGRALSVRSDSSDAVYILSLGSGGSALNLLSMSPTASAGLNIQTGGDGLKVFGSKSAINVIGGTDHGIKINTNAPNSDAIHIESAGGYGIYVDTTASGKNGIRVHTVNSDGIGLYADGSNRAGVRMSSDFGVAITANVSALSLACLTGPALSLNSRDLDGISIKGGRMGVDIKSSQTPIPSTGSHGVNISVGASATDSDGIHVSTSDGHGVSVDTSGSNKWGIVIDTTRSGIYGGGLKIDSAGDCIRMESFNEKGLSIRALNGAGVSILGGTELGHTGVSIQGFMGVRIKGNGTGVLGANGDALQLNSDNGIGFHVLNLSDTQPAVHIDSLKGDGIHIEARGNSSSRGIFVDGYGGGIIIDGGSGSRVQLGSSDGIPLVLRSQTDKPAAIIESWYGPSVEIEAGSRGGGGDGLSITANHGHAFSLDASYTGTGAPRHGININALGLSSSGINIDASSFGIDILSKYTGLKIVSMEDWGVYFQGESDGLYINSNEGYGINASGELGGMMLETYGSGAHGLYCNSDSGSGIMAESYSNSGFRCVGATYDIEAKELVGLLKLSTVIDGVTVERIMELNMARVDGRYVITPGGSTDDITFYNRDNTTPLTSVRVSSTGRERL